MMPARLSLALALVLSACTSHEGPVTSSDPTPEPQRADIKVAVASVQMIQDCPDPPDAPAAEAAAPIIHPVPGYAPPPPDVAGDVAAGSVQQGMANKVSAGAALPGTGGWSPPCTQSTVQLSLTNDGKVDGQIHITAMRLLDAASKREVGRIASRKPSQWFEPGGYRPWDERVAAGQTIKVGYRIGEPNQQPSPNDGSLNSSQTYILEIDVAVDGRTVTVRSAEFVREPIYQIVT